MAGKRPDVIVVGGGLIGMSLAWRLAQRGLRVAVLDAGTAGGEASTAGAGMLAPGGEFEQPGPWADFAIRSLGMYPDFVSDLHEESGIAIDFRTCGAMDVAFSGDDWRELAARAAAQIRIGIQSVELDARAARELHCGLHDGIERALYYPDDAVVNPRDLVSALRGACHRREVEILEGERAECVHAREDADVWVECRSMRISAGMAIIAAGAWSSRIPVYIEGRTTPTPTSFPVKGHLIGFHLEAGSLASIVRHGHTYLLQRQGGFTIAGSSTEQVGFERTVDTSIAAGIASRAAGLLPRLEGRAYETWTGLRPASESGHPEIGRLPGANIWLAYGHYRNGILLAPATAERIVKEMLALTPTLETDSLSPTSSP